MISHCTESHYKSR